MQRSVVVVAVAAFFAVPAGARLGNAAYLVAGSCNGCHSGVSRPEVTVTQTTPDPLLPGGAAVFHVEMTSTNNGGVGRKATFAASVLRTAGTFEAGVDVESCELTGGCPSNRTAVRDIVGRDFVDGVYAWDITLSGLQPGRFNLAVGVNDINGDDETRGDRNLGVAVPFVVGEGEGEEGEGEEGEGEEGEGDVTGEGEGDVDVPDGSCCAGSASQASVSLLGLLLLRRRRRRRR